MNTVYKYCDRCGLETLRRLELKVTPPNLFNDPFEFTPRMLCSNSFQKAKELVKDKKVMWESYLFEKENGRFSGNFRQFQERVKKYRPQLINQTKSYIPGVMTDLQKGYLDRISRLFGVLCLSKRRDSILMWGHYADKHCGLAIGFARAHELFCREKGLCEVRYVKERVEFDSSWREGEQDEREFYRDLIFSKNEDWAYEHEVRQLFSLAGLRNAKLKDGSIGYFQPIQPDAIVSVTLGVKASIELEASIKSELQKPHFSHVKLDRAGLHASEFSLQFG